MIHPKNILITGASSGLGEALALYYAQKGIFLALLGRDEKRLEYVAHACRHKGAEVVTRIIDVTHQQEMEAWITEVDAHHPLDLIIANAGISGGTASAVYQEPVDQVRKIFDVNLNGVLNTIDPILPLMLARGQGQIAVVSSLVGFRGWPTAPAYSASKGAVRFYGEALRGALNGSGIHVNVICPGFVKSRMTAANNFSMPFLMGAEKAANIIACGLARNQGRIAFPWPTHFLSWFISILPDGLIQKLLIKLPKKG